MRRFLQRATGKASNGQSSDRDAKAASVAEARALLAAFLASGLFDNEWYLLSNPDLAAAKVSPLEHFIEAGWREGRRPNPMFDPTWYLQRYPDVAAAGMNPLVHYWRYGERENRQPVAYFDTQWYKETYKGEIGTGSALAHFLRHRHSRRHSPNRYFDIQYYLKANPDVAAANVDPFEHFITTGHKEGRSPSPQFDVNFYTRSYMHGDARDPLSHYFEVGRAAGYSTGYAEVQATQAGEIRRFTNRAPEFEEFRPLLGSKMHLRGKLMAFYLPQFHAFPENDQWWGKGFTEWTNLARATPRFEGHYQPRIPRDLGFYDLRSHSVIDRQVSMAKAAGIHGFCFYYYNFNGKRLLHEPVDHFLSTPALDFPFCLMWANENWTRRWDGFESEVLIRQDYRPEDATALVADIARHFADLRYVRVEGRPLFILYRPDVVPNMAETLALWRTLFLERHNERPIILMVQGFGSFDPRKFGFDGAIEFPPHKVTADLRALNSSLRLFDLEFSARVCSYDDVVSASTSEATPDYPLIKTIVPSWDNDARRQGHGMVMAGSTPKKYEKWLDEALRFAKKHPAFGESFVFVNAWNEWAEAAYLEPDIHFGGAYLNATSRALSGTIAGDNRRRRILLVGHDAHRHGAQLLLLHIATTFRRRFGFEVAMLLCEGGEMVPEYERVAQVMVCSDSENLRKEAERLAQAGIDIALTNTVVAGLAVPPLKGFGFRVASLVHELPKIIRERRLEAHAKAIATCSDEVIFPADAVSSAFEAAVGPVAGSVVTRPQGLYNEMAYVPEARNGVREQLNLPPDCKIVINVGYADLRKGIDLFCRAARLVAGEMPNVKFLWVGNVDPLAAPWFDDDRANPDVIFLGQRRDVDRLLSAADVFALTSREDPFPSVLLEALSVGLPVVAFDDAGGFVDLLRRQQRASLVPYCSVDALAKAILTHLRRPVRERARASDLGRAYAFDEYVFWLLKRLDPSVRKVSVIVPNFNYERFLQERLTSIFDQSYPLFEVIVLDDASSDDSVDVIRQVSASAGRAITLVENDTNSGNPFAQWAKGLALARGELVWIAEADDIADRDFLKRLVGFFDDDATSFAFSDSIPIDAEGRPLGRDYKDYYARLFPEALSADLCADSGEFASTYLSQRNTILNASSVLWRTNVLTKALQVSKEELESLRLAGDWLLYLAACAMGGKVGYCATPLNSHRRHSRGVTSQTVPDGHLDEISQIHAFFNRRFGAGADYTRSQREYLKELTEQFQR
jgi:glycosyltransferase involved in cell wall biosynthesis